jgi:ornithine cyclodeaminase/alanine dehydrogenase-like protein (mu-crystallin family)
MKIVVLTYAEVCQLLPMRECIAAMEQALTALAQGHTHQPLRTVVRPPDSHGLMALMPAFRSANPPLFGLKAICVFPGNVAKGKDAHQGGVLLFSGQTGEPLALMNASAITEIRTAAVSAVATRLLAREDANKLAIIGTGVQARSHLEALARVRQIKRVRVASRDFGHAQAFAEQMQDRFSFPIEPAADGDAAARGADLIVTATTALEPVLKRESISAGAHINAIGTFSPHAREIDSATMAAAILFVDRRESALHEAGDYLLAEKEGLIGPDHIRAEVGEVLIGARPGRTSPSEITLFKSLGLAIEDLSAASLVYEKARRQNVGTWTEF